MPLIGLIDRILNRCGDKEAEAVSEVFDALKQPLPQAGQYHKGHESDTVFLNKLGVVIRVAYAESFPLSYKLRHNKDPLIAQPLRSPFDLDKVSFEILPALDSTEEASEDELSFLIDSLNNNGIDFWDTKKGRYNTSRLPWQNDDFPNGLRVVTDRGGIKPQKDFTLAAQNISIAKQIPNNLQAIIFAPFIEKLAKAWPEGQSKPDPSKINEFLDLCQEDVNLPADHPDKTLISSGWGMDTVRAVAERYEHSITI